MQNPDTINRRNLIAFFASLCLFLSAVEYVIPKPLPFMRLGLANMPLVLALYVFGAKEILLLVLLKILGQGFITGTLFSYIFLFSDSQFYSIFPCFRNPFFSCKFSPDALHNTVDTVVEKACEK